MKKSSTFALFGSMLFQAVIGVAAFAPAGCASNAKSLSSASATKYQISTSDLLDIAVQVTKDKYAIKTTAPDGFVTEGKWYNPQGASENRGGDSVTIKDGSINVAILVKVSRTDDNFSSISVKTIAKKYKIGMSALEDFDDDDISKPGWVDGKAEALAGEIAIAAKKYELGAAAAPGATAPTAPAEGVAPGAQ
jgi:hypothetical protein